VSEALCLPWLLSPSRPQQIPILAGRQTGQGPGRHWEAWARSWEELRFVPAGSAAAFA